MKNFSRDDLSFSLCGLNCALCSMKLDGHCPGCGGGVGNQGCSIARCSLNHGGYTYCYECDEYLCQKYEGITQYDSFITHRNQINDMNCAQNIGLEAYCEVLTQKTAILKYLLENYNDGRRKTFFCLAVNLLSLQELKTTLKQATDRISDNMTEKEKTLVVVGCLEEAAKQRNIILKMNKKPAKKN